MGKSVVARILAQYFIDQGFPFVAIDADTSHPTLRRYYADYTRTADLGVFESADQIMDRALGAERRVLVDLPAQSSRAIERWMREGDVLTFARESGIAIHLWHVTDGGYDSVDLLERVLDELGDQIHHVVVRNFGRASDFTQLDESAGRRQLDEIGGAVVDLPALDGATMYRVDRTGASFWAAVHSTAPPLALAAMDRQRVRRWLRQCYGALEGVGL